MKMQNTDLKAIAAQRKSEIKRYIDDVKQFIPPETITGDMLNSIKQRLLLLATHKNLFNAETFPVKEGDGTSSLYLLSEESDHTSALYVVSELKGNMSPPHNHTTWAVIVGIEGEEINKFYKFSSPPKDDGKAKIQEYASTTVAEGNGITLMPDDIHSIHCLTEASTVNFHFYGKSIEHLPNRKAFNMQLGTYKTFPANPHIYK